MANPLIPQKPTPIKLAYARRSAGILDDYAVRKNVATKEGTIEHIPTDDNHITNKKYVDNAISSIDLSSKVSKSGDSMTGTLVNVEEAQVRNIELVSAEPDVLNMTEGTIYLVYEDV